MSSQPRLAHCSRSILFVVLKNRLAALHMQRLHDKIALQVFTTLSLTFIGKNSFKNPTANENIDEKGKTLRKPRLDCSSRAAVAQQSALLFQLDALSFCSIGSHRVQAPVSKKGKKNLQRATSIVVKNACPAEGWRLELNFVTTSTSPEGRRQPEPYVQRST